MLESVRDGLLAVPHMVQLQLLLVFCSMGVGMSACCAVCCQMWNFISMLCIVFATRHGPAELQNLQGSSWGNQRAGGLTESQIREELQNSGTDEIPMSVRNASNTVAWWRSRQAVIDLKVCA